MTEERLPSKFAFILHADIAGSTELVRQDEHIAHKRIRDTFRRFDEIIKKYHGHVRELRGDALLAEFERASDAVTAALAFQADQPQYNTQFNDSIQPTVRVGIAMGEVVIADNTITGDGVVLAQRLEQLAESGGVCIQDAAYQSVPKRLPFEYEDLGEQVLKGFEDPVRAYAITLKSGEFIPLPETRSTAMVSKIGWRTMVGLVVAALIVVGAWLAWFQPWLVREEPASIERMAFPLPDKPSIAVLPFDNLGGDPEQEILADGLSNDIITDLSKFKHLFVIASNSTFSYKGKAVKVQQVAEELGVRYVLEGSFQKVGERLRINAQLIDATAGHHLWAERYDQDASDFFAIQEVILRTIVASLASRVTEAEIERALGKETDDLGAYDYYQRAWKLFFTFTKEGNNQALELLEKAIELDPGYARAYGLLAWAHAHNSSGRYSWGEDPERSLDLALKAARKAVQLAPDDYITHWALGFTFMVHGDSGRAEAEYDRALALNSNDATLLTNMAELLYKTGKAAQAIAQIKLAIRINPRHPDWYFWDLGIAQYLSGQYQEALDTLNRISNPSNGVRRIRAAVLVRLGRLQEAREVMSKFIETDLEMTLEEMDAFAWKDREGLGRWIEDLRVAGLPEKRPLPLPDKPSIAVLPFTNMSADPQQEYFVDGMTEDLITDLSQLSGLFVIARNSVFTYKDKAVKVKQVAEELGVRYVMEGSVRRVGNQVRINAQLIDATTGGHLWAERYDGTLDDVFGLQDRVTSNIVTVLAVQLSASDQGRATTKETASTDAYDAFLKGWNQYLRQTPDGFVQAIAHFERASAIDPSYSRTYAALAATYWQSWKRFWHTEIGERRWHDARVQAEQFLAKAMQNPTPLAHQLASAIALQRGKPDKATAEAERSIAMDPNDAEGYITLADALIYGGDAQQGALMVEHAMRLNPHYPPYYLYELGLAQFALGLLDQAATEFKKAVALNPNDVWSQRMLLATYGQLGRDDNVARIRENLSRSDFLGLLTTKSASFWHPFQDTADKVRFAEGLRKAGIPD